jgi:DNA-binding beta-propeller fold protein YncE
MTAQPYRSALLSFACATLLSTAAAAALADPATGTYEVVQRWQVGGTGGWDYLTIDAARHRLFVSRGDHVDVVDTTTGKVSGRIADTNGVHGVVLAEKLHRGYTTNGKANSITEFDLDSLKVLREVPIPAANPDAALYEPNGNHLYVFNGKSRDALVLDAATLEVVKKLPMPDKPEFAQDDGAGHVYVNIESENGQLVRIDAKTLAIDATWALPGCATPSGLALDRKHGRLFSVCDGNVMAVTDARTGRQVAKVAIGEGPDAAEYDAAHALVLSSNGGGTLSVIHQDSADHYRVATTVPTQKGARTMAFDPTTRRVYLVTSDFGPAPAATAEQPHPRPTQLPGTFTVLVAEPR